MACEPGGKESMIPVISVIGGADGPTTIYLAPKWIVGMLIVFAIVLLGIVMLGLARSLKKKNRTGMLVFGVLGMIMVLAGLCVIAYTVWSFFFWMKSI